MKKILLYTSLAGLTLLIGAAAVLQKGPFKKQRTWPQHPVDAQMVKAAESFVEVSVSPKARYSYAIMKPGVIQHLDRRYTYDVIPDELLNGALFQGLHRPPAGTEVAITVKQPTDIYFFFHHTVDGGYGNIFEQLSEWKRIPAAPQYDIKSKRGHGLKMIMYHLRAEAGDYQIPPTTADRACFNIVFQHVKPE